MDEQHERLKSNFSLAKTDHQILNTTCHLAESISFDEVALVTKDVNLRMKAKSIGLMAQDYTTDHVKDLAGIYQGRRVVENISGDLIEQLYQSPYEIASDQPQIDPLPLPNEYLVLRNGSKSALGVLDASCRTIRRIENRKRPFQSRLYHFL